MESEDTNVSFFHRTKLRRANFGSMSVFRLLYLIQVGRLLVDSTFLGSYYVTIQNKDES